MQHLQYNPSHCIGCNACVEFCPQGCISLDPLTIYAECINCEQCINVCPDSEKMLRMGHNDELGGGWVSPFGYQPSTNPSESKKDDSTSENPSKPNDKESSQDSSTDSKEESKGETSQEPSTKPSTDNPTTPTNPTISPEIDSILTPPSKIQASIKVINAIDSLRQYLQSLR